ncbi:MAG: DegT/DnrJ/EryC1/StrS family aminotransferase [Colwellia sp.]
MPNINAALGCAQMESITEYLRSQRILASRYDEFFKDSGFEFVKEPKYAQSNYWLNAVIFESVKLSYEMLVEINR